MGNQRTLLLLLLLVGLTVLLAGPGHELLHGDAHGESCPVAHIAFMQFEADLTHLPALGEGQWIEMAHEDAPLPLEGLGNSASRAPPLA